MVLCGPMLIAFNMCELQVSAMALTQDEIDGLIAAVRDAARTEIMPRFRRLEAADVATKTNASDLVTVADRASEQCISRHIARLMPDARVVGEEAVSEDPAQLDLLKAPGRAVVIDPIDGTWNYAAGIAAFGVILAVVAEGQTVFGLLYDPVLDDWIMAQKGGGAWYHRPGGDPVRLKGPPVRPKRDAHAFVPLALYPEADRMRIASQFSDWARVTSLRCACHEYRTLAFGYADMMTASGPKPWDHAAGVLVISECGGRSWSAATGQYDPTAAAAHLAVIGNAAAEFDPETDFH